MDYKSESPSEINRRRLSEICEKAGYIHVRFSISPNCLPTLDGAIAEAANALERFYEDEITGRLVPDNDERC